MNYLFQYENNKDDCINFVKLCNKTMLRKRYFLIQFFYCFIGLLLFRVFVLPWHETKRAWIIMIFTLIFFVVVDNTVSPRVTALRWEKERRFKEQVQIGFEDGGVRYEVDLNQSVISYDVFTGIYHWRETYFLFIDKTVAYILPERGLVEGDLASFGAFLEQKTGLKIKELK